MALPRNLMRTLRSSAMSRPVPSGWRRVRLHEVTEEMAERVGGRTKPIVLSSTKNQGLVPSEEYFRGRRIYSDDLSNYKLVKRGWFAYATNHLAEGSIGLLNDFDEACVSPIYTVFRCADSVYAPYLYRLLKTHELINSYALHEQASVDRRGAVRYRDFSRIEIVIPDSVSEQQHIADIFDTLNERVALTARIIDKLNVIRKSMVQDLLTACRDKMLPMSSLCREITVGIVVKPTQYYADFGIPVLRSLNVREDGISLKNLAYMSAEQHHALFKSAVFPGDIVTVRTGAPGTSAVIPPTLSEANCVDIIISRPRSDEVVADYLATWINSPFGKDHILRTQGGLAQQHFNVGDMSRLLIGVPPLTEQKRIVDIVAASRKAIKSHRDELAKLHELQEGLTSELLTGQVRVSLD
jgi:type I restriction enzyme S subunit